MSFPVENSDVNYVGNWDSKGRSFRCCDFKRKKKKFDVNSYFFLLIKGSLISDALCYIIFDVIYYDVGSLRELRRWNSQVRVGEKKKKPFFGAV